MKLQQRCLSGLPDWFDNAQMMRALRPVAATLPWAGVLACATPAPGPEAFDLDRVRTAVVREDMRLPPVASDVNLANVGDVAVDSSGNIYVADDADMRIRVFSANGTLLRVMGQPGQGPGEFRSIGPGMGVVNGMLWVTDMVARRMTVFAPTGSVVATIALPQTSVTVDNGARVVVQARTLSEDWRLVGALYAPPPRPFDYTWPRLVWDTAGTLVDTLGFARVSASRDRPMVEVAGSAVAIVGISNEPLNVLAAGGTFHVLRPRPAVRGRGLFHVVAVGADGDTAFTRSYRYEPREVSAGYRRQMAARIAARMPASSLAEAERVLAQVPLPSFLLPVTEALASPAGELWLRMSHDFEEAQLWLVIDADGTPRYKVPIPANVRRIRHIASGSIWVEKRDENGVPYVARLGLRLR